MNKSGNITNMKDDTEKVYPLLEAVDGSTDCQFSVVENKLAALNRNQQTIYLLLQQIHKELIKSKP